MRSTKGGKPSLIATLGTQYYVTVMVVIPDSKQLAVCQGFTAEGCAHGHPYGAADRAREGRALHGLALSPDGTQIATNGDDMAIKLWDVPYATCTATLHGHTKCVKGLAYSPDGKHLASASKDRTVKLWDASATGGAH